MTGLSETAQRLQTAILAGETLWADPIAFATVRELVAEYREQWKETALVADRQRALITSLTAERAAAKAEPEPLRRLVDEQDAMLWRLIAERDKARTEVRRLQARLLDVERSHAKRAIKENPWPSAGFAEANLPSADDGPLGVTLSRERLLRFRSSFSSLNEFAAVVCGVPTKELTPAHLMLYYAREEDGRQKHPCARCGGTRIAERMPDGEPLATCECKECEKP